MHVGKSPSSGANHAFLSGDDKVRLLCIHDVDRLLQHYIEGRRFHFHVIDGPPHMSTEFEKEPDGLLASNGGTSMKSMSALGNEVCLVLDHNTNLVLIQHEDLVQIATR